MRPRTNDREVTDREVAGQGRSRIQSVNGLMVNEPAINGFCRWYQESLTGPLPSAFYPGLRYRNAVLWCEDQVKNGWGENPGEALAYVKRRRVVVRQSCLTHDYKFVSRLRTVAYSGSLVIDPLCLAVKQLIQLLVDSKTNTPRLCVRFCVTVRDSLYVRRAFRFITDSPEDYYQNGRSGNINRKKVWFGGNGLS